MSVDRATAGPYGQLVSDKQLHSSAAKQVERPRLQEDRMPRFQKSEMKSSRKDNDLFQNVHLCDSTCHYLVRSLSRAHESDLRKYGQTADLSTILWLAPSTICARVMGTFLPFMGSARRFMLPILRLQGQSRWPSLSECPKSCWDNATAERPPRSRAGKRAPSQLEAFGFHQIAAPATRNFRRRLQYCPVPRQYLEQLPERLRVQRHCT